MFATGSCKNDTKDQDPIPFICNDPVTGERILMFNFPLVAQGPPSVLVSVEVDQPKIIAGRPSHGMVTIDHAVNYAVVVSLSSSFGNKIAVTIPASVVIGPSEVSAIFPINTLSSPLYVQTPAFGGTIYANFNATKQASLTVLPSQPPTCNGRNADYCTDTICYTCLFFEPSIPTDYAKRMEKFTTADPLVAGDRDFFIWRATGKKNCALLDSYIKDAAVETDPSRKLQAYAVLAFTARECPSLKNGESYYNKAADTALLVNRKSEAEALNSLSVKNTFQPKFGDVAITTAIYPVNGATTMTLGDSTIELTKGMRIGTQVERVFRDWVSEKLDWSGELKPAPAETIVPWGEGGMVDSIMKVAPDVQVFPLSGTMAARRDGAWYGPDETGVFRFQILDDKMQYPTTHVDGNFGWIIDTHGISALVSQALEDQMQTVIGCGDSIGKAKAAYYLAQRGVNVINVADRFEYLLLGYQGTGTIIGNAPVHMVDGKPVVGHQPVQFSLFEPFVVENTQIDYPMQYYDTPARYFKRLSSMVPLTVTYVDVTDSNQLDKIFDAAKQQSSNAIGVRIYTAVEDASLRAWLLENPKRRAVLFHSGLYEFARVLFEDFPTQVTFGDLRPRFE